MKLANGITESLFVDRLVLERMNFLLIQKRCRTIEMEATVGSPAKENGAIGVLFRYLKDFVIG